MPHLQATVTPRYGPGRVPLGDIQTSSVQFTVRIPAVSKAAFDSHKLAQFKASLQAALQGMQLAHQRSCLVCKFSHFSGPLTPFDAGLANDSIAISTTEYTDGVSAWRPVTATHVHVQVRTKMPQVHSPVRFVLILAPPGKHVQIVSSNLPALRQFASWWLSRPNAIWRLLGSGQLVPGSVWVAFTAPKVRCTEQVDCLGQVILHLILLTTVNPCLQTTVKVYLSFVGKGEIMPFTALKQQQLAKLLAAALSLQRPYDASKISLRIVRSAPITGRRLQASCSWVGIVQVHFSASENNKQAFWYVCLFPLCRGSGGMCGQSSRQHLRQPLNGPKM